ncbi:hypothetical protein [Halodesulfovibrio spirochaetisodalis]|uniref:Uncharacterized protein n=1 Tax=Halodesulfovibrio spirochaetisodalis TaxID=1560234 RepID=A0A1B7XBN0_9BACT|nr:hypothetical protein [Halodesulfovibrio spirochaetisodalis]OBQ50123.1 hypothetical protein SP90_10830 [Halodesulfovibrio spirochaetisodalis]
MNMNSIYIMFIAICIAGGLYQFYPVFVMQYIDTIVVAFAALAYLLFVRPWLKAKLTTPKNDQTIPPNNQSDNTEKKG